MEPRRPRAFGLLPRLWLSIILLARVGGGGVPREGLASLLGSGSNGVKVLYATLLRDCGVFIFNLLYYSKNAAPPRAGGLAL